MSLLMFMTKGSSYPLLACDACGQPIDKAHEGMAMWDWPGTPAATPDPGECRLVFLHKGACDDRQRWPLSTELPYFFHELLHNMRIKPCALPYYADSLDEIPVLSGEKASA
jgi:hypothetical protein